jgi:hypothetical protein
MPWGVLYFSTAVEALSAARHLSDLIVAGVRLLVYSFDLYLYRELLSSLGVPVTLERKPYHHIFPHCDM